MLERDDMPTPQEWLLLYPEFLAEDLVDDETFRTTLGLRNAILITLGATGRFGQSTFYNALRSHHKGTGTSQVPDVEGKVWTIDTIETHDRTILKLTREDEVALHVYPHFVLHPDRQARIAEFERSLNEAGLWPLAMAQWRSILEERALSDDEVRRLADELEQTPKALSLKIQTDLKKRQGRNVLLAPDDARYYANLIGNGVASDLEDLAVSVVYPDIENLLASAGSHAPSMALLLSMHGSFVPGSALTELPAEHVLELLQWALKSGDVFSRLGAVELGLEVLARIPSAGGLLMDLVQSILSEDPEQKDGRLAFLSGILVYIGSELSRTRALDSYPPFQRRLAQFAQASFFERNVFGGFTGPDFAEWALQNGLQRFHFQTMIDRRLEPRWTSDYVTPVQLKAELVGRLSIAALRNEHVIPEGQLRDLMLGSGDGSVKAHFYSPQSHLPGPLEGQIPKGVAKHLPPEYEEILKETLTGETLEPRSVTALINLCSLFVIDQEKVDRAVHLIRTAGHRFDASVDVEKRKSIFSGLARLASETRNEDLAAELRLMVVKDRMTSAADHDLFDEFLLALNAASAFEDRDKWAKYLADWSVQLAFAATGKAAEKLQTALACLCEIEPGLRRKLGPANAALASVLP